MENFNISILCAVIGCITGVGGIFFSRLDKSEKDNKWKGGVDKRLENILSVTVGISSGLEKLREKVENHGERITACEQYLSDTNERIDML